VIVYCPYDLCSNKGKEKGDVRDRASGLGATENVEKRCERAWSEELSEKVEAKFSTEVIAERTAYSKK